MTAERGDPPEKHLFVDSRGLQYDLSDYKNARAYDPNERAEEAPLPPQAPDASKIRVWAALGQAYVTLKTDSEKHQVPYVNLTGRRVKDTTPLVADARRKITHAALNIGRNFTLLEVMAECDLEEVYTAYSPMVLRSGVVGWWTRRLRLAGQPLITRADGDWVGIGRRFEIAEAKLAEEL